MKGTKVLLKEDLVLQLHRVAKAQDLTLATLVEQLIREGLQSRRGSDALTNAGGSMDCPF
jgi:hypothetical protein